MVYTRRGDEGRTDLFSGERVSKDSRRIKAIGSVDELNSLVGLAATKAERKKDKLEKIQNDLHVLQAELADRDHQKQVDQENIDLLEDWIDSMREESPELTNFVLAGGTESAAFLDLARSVARRTERNVVALDSQEELRGEVLAYVNRLSDLFFTMARHENALEDVEEKNPEY
ncbi:MAG: cob(I)yrinic acid a,c-diamide adenosyltransferase [Candidatus Nanohaloarchaea archaeon]